MALLGSEIFFCFPTNSGGIVEILVVWEDYPLKKDYTWDPIENLYGHEDLAKLTSSG